MKLIKGAKGAAVSDLKSDLVKLGYPLSDKGQHKGVFGPKVDQTVRDFQKNNGLTVDGWAGAKTLAAIDRALAARIPVDSGDYFGARWIGVDLDLLGLSETDPRLVARYEPEWKKVGLPGYRGLAGTARAWCAIRMTKAFRQVGVIVKGLTAGAASFSRWGRKCAYWFGCALDIKHGKKGGRHVAFFLYWIDEKKKIAATLDGNRGNRFCVAVTDLSGKHDYCVSGPRWPSEEPDGQFVSMKDVLAKYPLLKVGSSGSASTR